MKKKKKVAGKKKVEKTKDLVLAYEEKEILFPRAAQFTFLEKGPFGEQVDIVAMELPGVATVVVGKEEDQGGPRLCWSYPAGTSMKDAVSKAFLEILEKACAQYMEAKKTEKKK